jgi:hypothetical protein
VCVCSAGTDFAFEGALEGLANSARGGRRTCGRVVHEHEPFSELYLKNLRAAEFIPIVVAASGPISPQRPHRGPPGRPTATWGTSHGCSPSRGPRTAAVPAAAMCAAPQHAQRYPYLLVACMCCAAPQHVITHSHEYLPTCGAGVWRLQAWGVLPCDVQVLAWREARLRGRGRRHPRLHQWR